MKIKAQKIYKNGSHWCLDATAREYMLQTKLNFSSEIALNLRKVHV